MPKLNLSNAIRIKGASGEIIKAKGAAFSWPAPAIVLGLSDSLLQVEGISASWVKRTIDMSDYAGAQIKLVWKMVIGTSGYAYRNDVQIDEIELDGNSYSFEASEESFETSYRDSSAYTSLTWYGVPSSSNTGAWCRDKSGTPTSGTGLSSGANSTDWYVFLESSSPASNGDAFWLRSPTITLSGAPGDLTFYEARSIDGVNTTIDFYADVIVV